MSRRSATETVAKLFVAFLRRKSWSQVELAREVGIGVRGLRSRLGELIDAGVPIERIEEPPHVYWRVLARSWFPSGTALDSDDTRLVARLIARLPPSEDRDRALARVLAGASPLSRPPAVPSAHGRTEQTPDGILSALEEAAAVRQAARMRYFTASRGERSTRHVSVHRIVYGPPVRFVATCHRSLNLKWFRADGVEALTVDPTVPFKDPPQSSLDEFLATSFEGFHDGRSAFMCILHVNAEHARWVVRNLPEPMLVEHCADGVRLSVRTAGVRTLARFVVGLGGGARAESEELAAEVAALARGALHGLGALPGSGALDEARDSADGDKRTRRGGPTLARTLFTPGSVPPRTST